MKRGLELFVRFDWTLLLAATTLTVIGLLAIYGIGITRDGFNFFQFQKQFVATLMGWGLVFGGVFFDYRYLRTFATPLYGFGAVLLAGVLLFGQTIRGTRGWYVIGRLSFQPVEIAKVTLAIFLAAYLSRHVHKRMTWVPFFGSALATGIYVLLVMRQPDFGSSVVLMVIWLSMVLFAGLPRRAWLVLFAVAIPAAVGLWTVGLKPFQRARLVSFIHPEADQRGAGYNVTQARIAIGSGGLLGKGIGEGSQSRLRFLPEASTDFVLSVIGEDLGFIGLTIILGLFGLLLYRLLSLAMSAADPFAQMLLVACIALIAFHLMVNAGMNLGIMPVTGIPLPFVSAAASSLVVAFCIIALAQSIAVRRISSTH